MADTSSAGDGAHGSAAAALAEKPLSAVYPHQGTAEGLRTQDPLDNTSDDPRVRHPLVIGNNNYGSITESVCSIAEVPLAKTHPGWVAGFLFSLVWLGVFGLMVAYLVLVGTGVWGINNPVGWGFAIVNFVFWVGIGHAGTLISAILFLFRQKWRTAINRFAEAMTIFAVICALTFPGIHVGRIWVAYWMLPYGPNSMAIWPQFRSPLLWDVFAVGTYFTISLLFWFTGLIPDLATMRDRATATWRKFLYGFLALGWRSSGRHWQHYGRAYLLLAALATPLVLSVHSVVSFDFAVAQLPGWHTTIFPPYFVAGAIFSGFAMVITLAVPARSWCGLESIITMKHLENVNKVILATGSMVGYAYITEFFIAWYSAYIYEQFIFIDRVMGPYWWAYAIMFSCNVIIPQAFWFKRVRTSLVWMFVISIFVNIGMWFERFVITVQSLHRDFQPSNWGFYTPTWVDILTLIGSFGLFFTLFLLFARLLPIVAIAEVKEVLHEQEIDQARYKLWRSRDTQQGDVIADVVEPSAASTQPAT